MWILKTEPRWWRWQKRNQIKSVFIMPKSAHWS